MNQLIGKVAIVTGSGRGIGQQIALRLARDGADVVVNDLDPEPAAETVKLIEGLGRRAIACNGDVTAPDFGDRIVKTAAEKLGGVHIIVNNAGYTIDSVIQKMTDENWPFGSCAHSPITFARSFPPSSNAANASSARSSISHPGAACTAMRARSTTPRPRRL
jgi:enoyl-[acyl-carrier-protein] reductase (NADH)